MSLINKTVTFLLAFALVTQFVAPRLEAVTYVTDTGGYAYDQCRAATNLAPAIALSTVGIVAIIAIAVQNSHGHSSHSSYSNCSSYAHAGSYPYGPSSSSSSSSSSYSH
jgi:hypothetical protein